MKKVNIREFISLPYLLVLVLFLSAVATSYISIDYNAKFMSETGSGDGARATQYVFYMTEASKDSTMKADISSVNYPGASVTIPFVVMNHNGAVTLNGTDVSVGDGNKVCEVTQEYNIEINTTEKNLPLNFTLIDVNNGNSTAASGEYGFDGFNDGARILPANINTTHSYKLVVKWDESYNDVEYAGIPDVFDITIHSQQIN